MGDAENCNEGGLVELYRKIHKAVEVSTAPERDRIYITIIIDDLSLLEVSAHGSSNHVLDFLHYCHTLTSEKGCSLVMLNHDDIYSSMTGQTLNLQMEYLADVVVKAEPLATGLASDVHGQLTILNKWVVDVHGSLRNKLQNFHFKVKENTVDYFYPGSPS
ncbi:hypothetical protein GIB67_018535 [Kingdonia uniflora]|uniref:Elongator complex protein 6 n=1 Tax=Kingdonia uniflora TaxID=39325 RepID=A0A7J7LWE9_9MAGN|nr:hypothetical protein GIB67_018535 [Kingdonia uniflora]